MTLIHRRSFSEAVYVQSFNKIDPVTGMWCRRTFWSSIAVFHWWSKSRKWLRGYQEIGPLLARTVEETTGNAIPTAQNRGRLATDITCKNNSLQICNFYNITSLYMSNTVPAVVYSSVIKITNLFINKHYFLMIQIPNKNIFWKINLLIKY